jgi:hypothetical protein
VASIRCVSVDPHLGSENMKIGVIDAAASTMTI